MNLVEDRIHDNLYMETNMIIETIVHGHFGRSGYHIKWGKSRHLNVFVLSKQLYTNNCTNTSAGFELRWSE